MSKTWGRFVNNRVLLEIKNYPWGKDDEKGNEDYEDEENKVEEEKFDKEESRRVSKRKWQSRKRRRRRRRYRSWIKAQWHIAKSGAQSGQGT